jgi:hypothetical protein
MNSGVLSGGRQDPPAKSFLDMQTWFHWESLMREDNPPAPPGGESKNVSPLPDKTVEERTLRLFSLVCPEELETAQVFG